MWQRNITPGAADEGEAAACAVAELHELAQLRGQARLELRRVVRLQRAPAAAHELQQPRGRRRRPGRVPRLRRTLQASHKAFFTRER